MSLASALLMLSNTALLHLVDQLVGLDADDDGLARLLWAVEARDEANAIRGYFVDLALNQYDAALTKTLPSLVDEIAANASEATTQAGLSLNNIHTGAQIDQAFGILDRFEDQFFEKIRAAVDDLDWNRRLRRVREAPTKHLASRRSHPSCLNCLTQLTFPTPQPMSDPHTHGLGNKARGSEALLRAPNLAKWGKAWS